MASFTDIIPKFNPYIQQLPVEAMVQVGMAKQQAYEQNVTKIQSQIDAIGGLDVTRDVDRKYLQSKINELGSKLNRLASGDFSNFQLVNSVGGMTNQIVKDDVVKTAVNSTAWARKQREKIEKGKSDGTWSVENEDLYNEQYKKWYNGTEAGESFSSEYVPYRDVYKKLREIAKDVGVEESLVQNLFNPDGSVNRVMVETYSKGKDPNKIYEAFVNGIDQSDYRQLAITGRYKYKGYTNDQLVEILQTSNNDFTAAVNARKLDLQQKLSTLDKAIPTLKKSEDKVAAENQRNQILKAITNLDEQIAESNTSFSESSTKLASGDEDYANLVRSRIHTNKFLTTLSKDFADKNSYVKYAENPLWKAMMEEKKFAFDQWKAQQDISLSRERNAIARRQAEATERTNKLKEDEILGYATAGARGGGTPATRENIIKSYEGYINERDENYRKLAQSLFPKDAYVTKSKIVNGQRVDEKILMSPSEQLENYVNAAIRVKNKGDDITKYGTYKTRQQVLMELGMSEQQRVASVLNNKDGSYTGAANTLDRNLVKTAIRADELSRRIDGMKATMIDIETQYRLESGGKRDVTVGVFVDKPGVTPKPSSTGNWLQDLVEGRTFTLNPFDWFVDKVENAKSQDIKSITLSGDDLVDLQLYVNNKSKEAGSRISSKYGKQIGDQLLIGAERIIYPSEGLEKKYQEAFEGFYPQNFGFTMNEKNRDIVVGNMNSALFNNPAYTEDVRETLFKNGSQVLITSTPGTTGFGNTQYEIIVTGADGEVEDPIQITADQYEFLTKRKAPEVNVDMLLTRSRMNTSRDGSTNTNGIGVVETALFKGSDFVNIRNYNIGGMDITRDNENKDVFYPTLYIAPPGSNDYKPYVYQADMTLTQATSIPSLITDVELRSIVGF